MIEVVIEVDDERFILRIAGFHQRNGRLVHARALVAHAPAVVDHQAHADGNVFALEDRELLLDFVFQDAKILLLQAIGKAPAIIQHRGVQHHQVDVHANPRILPDRSRLAGRRRRRAGRCRDLRQRSGAEQQRRERKQSKETPASRKK
jgi:hypothetical protein